MLPQRNPCCNKNAQSASTDMPAANLSQLPQPLLYHGVVQQSSEGVQHASTLPRPKHKILANAGTVLANALLIRLSA